MIYGFEDIVYEMPSGYLDTGFLVKDAGIGEDMIENLKISGIQKVPGHNSMLLTELVRNAVLRLSKNVKNLAKRTYCVILAHSLPLLAPINVPFFEMCLEGLDFDGVPCTAVSGQPCAILHTAVKLAGDLLKEIPEKSGILIIGADKAYSSWERVFFNSAMGDVAVAGFLTASAKDNHILSSFSHSVLISCDGENTPEENLLRFRQSNPSNIRYAVEKCLEIAGVDIGELTYIVPHTPNNLIWDSVATLLRFSRDRILTNYISDTGHLNSNDSFVHYIRAIKDGLILEGDKVLLVNPGFGGTRGCTLIKR